MDERENEAGEGGVDVSATLLAASQGITLRLPSFEGPLDLLLHLIREHKLDVFDIPISFILDEYLGYLSRMRALDLDIASEFLVMAATLAHIKSRMLLPKQEVQQEEIEEEFGDPREDLVRRLLEYQKYKAAAEDLGRQDLLGRSVFTRNVRMEEVPLSEGEIGLREISVLRLIEAFDKVLKNLSPQKQHEVTLERISIGDAIARIADALGDAEELEFESLFDELRERHQVIATFLGLLEMVRLKLVQVLQKEYGDEIVILRTERLGMQEMDLQDDYA